MDDQEREELLDALVERLRDEGLPAGKRLFDVMRARRALALADDVLQVIERELLDDAGGLLT